MSKGVIWLYNSKGERKAYLTLRQFAHVMKISPATAYRWVAEGMPSKEISDDVLSRIFIPVVDAKLWAHRQKEVS